LKVSTSSPILFGSQKALKPTMNGICNRQTWSAYADPISILPISFKFQLRSWKGDIPERNIPIHGKRHGVHEFGSIGNEGKEGQPKEFLINGNTFQDNIDDIDQDFWSSATPLSAEPRPRERDIPAIMANRTVHPSNTPVLTPLVQLGDSCPPPSCSSSSVAALTFAARALCPEAFWEMTEL
jgi:hypothetical protein